MKRFRFPLHPVARLRSPQELRAREAFARAVHACTQAEQKLAAVRAHVAELESILALGRRDSFNATTGAAFFRAYREECARELAAERAATAARAELQARRADYLEANRKVKILQRLEEQVRSIHRRECDRAEQAEFDELAARRALRYRPLLPAS